MIKNYPKKSIMRRGIPNYRRKTWDFFEEEIVKNPDLEDPDTSSEIHMAIIRNELADVKSIIEDDPEAKELRNSDGKTPMMLAIEHER